jgi:hypothetical protein
MKTWFESSQRTSSWNSKTLSSLEMLLQMNAAKQTVHMDGSAEHLPTTKSQTASTGSSELDAIVAALHSQQKNSRKKACVAAFERAVASAAAMPDRRSYINTSKMNVAPISGDTTTRKTHRLLYPLIPKHSEGPTMRKSRLQTSYIAAAGSAIRTTAA